MSDIKVINGKAKISIENPNGSYALRIFKKEGKYKTQVFYCSTRLGTLKQSSGSLVFDCPKELDKHEFELKSISDLKVVQSGTIIYEEPSKAAQASLLGSSTQPSMFKLKDGSEKQLGEVVQTAFKESKLTVEEWNNLPSDKIEDHIQKVVNGLDLAEAPTNEEKLPKPKENKDGK